MALKGVKLAKKKKGCEHHQQLLLAMVMNTASREQGIFQLS